MKDAEDKLQELTLKYTDKHPDVVATRETLAQLKLRRDEEIAALRRGSPSVAVSSTANPVVQKMQVSLNEAEVEIAGLRSKLADKERTVDSLRAMVNIVPEVEVEYARLNRDYDFTRSQYNEFVARLDKTNLGQEAESAESIKFEVIKPPSAGMKPVRPNRPLLMTAVLLVSLVVGCGLAYLLHVLRPVFHSDQALQGFTGFPVLGVVAMTWLERYRQRRIRSYAGYALAVLGLFVALLIVLQLQQWMPLSLSRS
jgi:polysaccharide chain length determinant protein (PEP-CTERM system associated)